MTEMRERIRLNLYPACRLGCALILLVGQTMAEAQTPPNTTNSNTNTEAISQSWQQLTPRQKQALAPLGTQWSALTAQQQRKWLTISQNFSQLSASEQSTMHTRMADWVALSPQQRNVARYNFNTVQNLPTEDKKAKWEAYQALSAEEKRLLSAGSAGPTKSAATTAKPQESNRLVHAPIKPTDASRPASASTIDRKTLLPRPSTLAAPSQIAPASSSETAPETSRNATETAPS